MGSLSVGTEAEVWCQKRKLFFGAHWMVTKLETILEIKDLTEENFKILKEKPESSKKNQKLTGLIVSETEDCFLIYILGSEFVGMMNITSELGRGNWISFEGYNQINL